MSSITTLLPGASTVSPESSTSTQSSGIGLSTQLIIWGMVAFVLLELIAIFCLLRYCCRARYMKRKKFKEKEIILSDFAGGPPSLFNNTNTNNNKNLSSNMLETSHTHFGGSNMSSVETKQILNENQSVNSLRPIIYNQNDLNDTIMIDDIVSNYTIQQQQQQLHQPDNQATTTTTTSTSHKPTKSSTEDIYTFRFSSQQPIEQFDPSGPIEQHSYLYNGSLNRPAFEIISHADIRPTTPIRFEHVKDLPHNKKHHHHHRHHHHNKNYLDEFELIEHDGPADFHYKQRIYGDGGFESSSWYSNNQQHYRQNSSRSPPADHSRRRSNKARRSFTSPDNNINSNNRLNYGNQESIHAKGKPVEWQMARELRTTDWDRLKYYTDNTLHSFYERPDPNRYYSINEIDNETSRNNNNYRTRKSTTATTDQSNEYNNSKLKNIPNRKESSSYRSSSHDDKNSIIMSSPPPVPSSSSADHNHHHQIGEQSKNNKKTLLDYISSNSSDISSFNKLNLYKNKLIDNSNEIKNNIIIDSNKKSDINENSLYEWRRRSSSDGRGGGGGGGGEEEEEELPKRRDSSSTLLSSSNNTNGKPAILTKIIRDPDTNEILSKTRIKETDLNNSSRKMSNEQLSPTTSNQLDRSNISVIDVSYNNSPRPNTFNRRLSSINQTDEQDYEISETSPTTPLPPPLPFQLNNSNIEQNNYTSIIPVNNNNNNNNNNRLSPILSKENSNSSNYESSIIESITKHANEDFQPSEILDISQQNIYHSRLESPDLYSNNNNNNKSVFKNSFNEKTKMILENKLTSTNNKSGNIFQDIQSFDPNQLRPVKKKISDSNYYDKIADSSSNRSSSIISNNNHNNKYKPPSVIQSISSRNNDDKSSVASSSRLSKRSSQMY